MGTADPDSKIYQPTTRIRHTSELPDIPLVILAPAEGRFIKGSESLLGFTHFDECIYLFGGSHEVLTPDEVDRAADALVYVPLVKHEAYAHAVAYMTLYDRMVKRGQSSNR
jgi:predicted lipase